MNSSSTTEEAAALNRSLVALNSLPEADLVETLKTVCGSSNWAARVASRRPYVECTSFFQIARDEWWELEENDWLEAFKAHPQIGDLETLRKKYSKTYSPGEQATAMRAKEEIFVELQECNARYLSLFGFIFIVCATGKTAEEMLTILKRRLTRERHKEVRTAAEEEAKITLLRLKNLLLVQEEKCEGGKVKKKESNCIRGDCGDGDCSSSKL